MSEFFNSEDKIMETLDNSNLLRGLLVLISKDKNIWDHEADIFISEGMKLGYDKEFCQNAIRYVLQNSYINHTPPIFFYRANALKLLHIGLRIINTDLEPHPEKVQFLDKVALINELINYWNTIGFNKFSHKVSSPDLCLNGDMNV